MRLWPLAVLPLFWSCADNFHQPDAVLPELGSLRVPTEIVADWAQPLEFSAQALLPQDEAEWTLLLHISAEGFRAEYLLRDDGNYGALSEPGPGQAPLSGDNVAGDGWFTTSLDSHFSTSLGAHTLHFTLRRNGVVVDVRQLVRNRVENRPPLVVGVDAPASLASGASFTATVRLADPDGMADLDTPQLRQSGGVMRSWNFISTGDSTWSVTVGPELAAGRLGQDTLDVVVRDLVGHEAISRLPITLENSAPVLATSAFELWIWDAQAESYQRVTPVDTLRLQMPAADAAFFHLSIPISDPQTAADLASAQWSISRVTTPMDQVVWFEMDDLGPDHEAGDWVADDGVWSGAFQLPWNSPIADRVLRIRATDQVGQLSPMAEWPVLQLPAGASPRGGGLAEIGPGKPARRTKERAQR